MKVIVTGATRGIGRAIAERFASEGHEVYGTYVNSEYEARLLEKRGFRMFRCDVSSKNEVASLYEKTGPVDVLVNNAGVSLCEIFQNVTPDAESRLYGVNLFGVLNMTRRYLPDMINAKYGVIINVSSVFGEVGGSMEVDYSASKAALIGLTKALSKEVGPSCVRVNCITPGIIDTDMNAALSVEDVRNIVECVPLESLGQPQNVADAVYFLASEDASYITGAVIPVDGGWKG